MAKYTAIKIAEWFLYYNDVMMNDADADYISNLKLQKLLYYAQGCFLAIKNVPLFDDPIVAWEHGPVVESVYQMFKHNRSNGIIYNGEFDGGIDKEDEELLIDVYDVFAKYSAWGLRNLTHNETPWLETNRNEVIDIELIKSYFKENYMA